MREIWKIDKYGFCTNGKMFFSIRDIKAIDKTDDCSLTLTFFASQRTITWEDPKDQNHFFKLFTDKMIEIVKKEREHFAAYQNYQDALLATQKSIINAHIGVVK